MVIYWDTSPIIALLAREPSAGRYRRFANQRIVTGWGTALECVSALARRQREGAPTELVAEGYRRLEAMRAGWEEVQPSEDSRRTATRLLKTHALGAGDALQLGAALVAAGFEPHAVRFLTEDRQLGRAAEAEGCIVELLRV